MHQEIHSSWTGLLLSKCSMSIVEWLNEWKLKNKIDGILKKTDKIFNKSKIFNIGSQDFVFWFMLLKQRHFLEKYLKSTFKNMATGNTCSRYYLNSYFPLFLVASDCRWENTICPTHPQQLPSSPSLALLLLPFGWRSHMRSIFRSSLWPSIL